MANVVSDKKYTFFHNPNAHENNSNATQPLQPATRVPIHLKTTTTRKGKRRKTRTCSFARNSRCSFRNLLYST